jgi:hypothetical protein
MHVHELLNLCPKLIFGGFNPTWIPVDFIERKRGKVE